MTNILRTRALKSRSRGSWRRPTSGPIVEDLQGKLTVSAMEPGSAVVAAKLAAQDVITAADGNPVDVKGLNEAIAAKKPGDTMELTISRDGSEQKINATLGHKLERSWVIKPMAAPDALQAAILKDWMGGKNLTNTKSQL